jgi:hypothetical protein
MKPGPTALTRMPLGGVLDGGGAGEPDHAVLGRDVGARLGEPDRAQDRGHVDDGAAAVGHHRRELVAHAEEDAVEVDRQDLAPALDRVLAGWHLVSADAGVVHGDVQPAVVGHDALDHRPHLTLVGHVGGDRGGPAPGLPGDPLGGLLGDVGDDYGGPPAPERVHAGLADPSPASGDEGDLAIHCRGCHGCSPWLDCPEPPGCPGNGTRYRFSHARPLAYLIYRRRRAAEGSVQTQVERRAEPGCPGVGG